MMQPTGNKWEIDSPKGLLIFPALLIAALAFAKPHLAIIVLLSIPVSILIWPLFTWLEEKTELPALALVGLSLLALLVGVGLAGYFVFPLIKAGVLELKGMLPTDSSIPLVDQILNALRNMLGDLIPPGTWEDTVRKQLEKVNISETAKPVLLTAANGMLGMLYGFGSALFALGLVYFRLFEQKSRGKAFAENLTMALPNHKTKLLKLESYFQDVGTKFLLGIGLLMLIFWPVYFITLVGIKMWFGGISLGLCAVYACILAFWNAIPIIGGITSYAVVAIIWLFQFAVPGHESAFLVLAIMGVAALGIHKVETYLSPMIIGERLGIQGYWIFVTILTSVATFGVREGLFAAVCGLALFSAYKRMVRENHNLPVAV